MRILPFVPVLFFAAALPCQQGGASSQAVKPAPTTTPKPSQPVVQFDPTTGWPIGADDGPIPAAPKGETAPRKDAGTGTAAASPPPERPASTAANTNTHTNTNTSAPGLASGTQLGSPLLDIYAATGSPAEWKKLGGVVAQWRVVVHGPNGEEIGVREIVHTADVTHPDRDRLDFADGRVEGRLGGQVFAERNGMPMPAATEPAALELALFGAQLRTPWLFGDAGAYAVVGRTTEDRGGERLRKVLVERRPPAVLDRMGPEPTDKPVDRFELLYDASSGALREFVHRFAETQQTRRVLLEDWRDVEGVRMPCRRVYVDEAMRPTTAMELVKVERRRVAERDFRQP